MFYSAQFLKSNRQECTFWFLKFINIHVPAVTHINSLRARREGNASLLYEHYIGLVKLMNS